MISAANLDHADLPGRVRQALKRVLARYWQGLQPLVEGSLQDATEKLSVLAHRAEDAQTRQAAADCATSLRANASQVLRRLHGLIEAELASIRTEAAANTSPTHADPTELRLVEYDEIDEHTLLDALAQRLEARASLSLALVGQRFGVLGATAPVPPELLPVGPHRTGRMLQLALERLNCQPAARRVMVECFRDRAVDGYQDLINAVDEALVEEEILPGLRQVGYRRQTSIDAGAAARRSAHTGWPSDGIAPQADDPQQLIELERLLALWHTSRSRATADETGAERLSAESVDALLQMLQQRSSEDPPFQNLRDLRLALLANARGSRGGDVALQEDHGQVLEVMDRLFRGLLERMRPDAVANHLLLPLQIPMLRAALRDHGVFVQQRHPARELLGLVAEHGAHWLDDDDLDPQLPRALQQAVGEVGKHYAGNDATFADALGRLHAQLDQQRRRAELLERRNVEAMLGKERLALAKHRAAEVLDAVLQTRQTPATPFRRQLLQAWADVLALVLLQSGEESDAWKRTEQLTRIVAGAELAGADAPALREEVAAALARVGHHQEQAEALAEHLVAPPGGISPGSESTLSRTELSLHMKTLGRLGADTETLATTPEQSLTRMEQRQLDTLRELPFGAWLELDNGRGGQVRRRLAWYSQVTDNALLVNPRGQRVGEPSLRALARQMAEGKLRVVPLEEARLIDRIWRHTLESLRQGIPGAGTRPSSLPEGGP